MTTEESVAWRNADNQLMEGWIDAHPHAGAGQDVQDQLRGTALPPDSPMAPGIPASESC